MIGIDVGGANLKVVDNAGVHIHYCPLWEGAPLRELLMQYGNRVREGEAAVVMTGELADCFGSKSEGIAFIVDTVMEVFPGARFYGTDARFHSGPARELAAANWLVSADYLRELYPDAILVDVGSTTTDIIPLHDFNSLTGLTDTRRLQLGYLVYTGMLRTPVQALLRSVILEGVETGTSTENFAIAADAQLVLGHITIDQYSCDAPDRGEKTPEAAVRRLARVVCADPEEIGGEMGSARIAYAFWHAQRQLVSDKLERVRSAHGPGRVVTAGIGSALFAWELGGTDLAQTLGTYAGALPAFAVREVALRDRGN